MFWSLILAPIALITAPQPVSEDFPAGWRTPRNAWEPQTPAEEAESYQALYGYGSDIVLEEGDFIENSISDHTRRWPGYPGSGKVPYVIDSSIDSKYHEIILRAIEQYNKLTCVKFTPRKKEKDYVKILKDKTKKGCWSNVGKITGEQKLSLDNGCYKIGIIVHELGHAIGFMHEHQRSDRNKYVTVYEDNIKTGFEKDFKRAKKDDEIIFNDFDYNSIMLYGNYAHSKNPKNLKTITANDGRPLLEPYHKPGLDSSDIRRVNLMYVCNKM